MKLPDIKFGAVPEFKSEQMAALPNKLRTINAGTQAIRQGIKELDSAFEQEAELTARSALNEAKRQYVKRSMDTATSYHTDTSKDASDFMNEMEGIRSEISAEVTGGVSKRANRYLSSGLDSLWTASLGPELEVQKRLVHSRGIMRLNEHLQDSTEIVVDGADFDMAMSAIADYESGVDTAPLLTPAETDKAKSEGRSQIVSQFVYSRAEDGVDGIEDLTKLRNSDMFKQLSVQEQKVLNTQITDAVSAAMTEAERVISSDVELLNVSREDGITEITGLIDKMDGLTPSKRDEMVTLANQSMTLAYMKGLINAGEYDKADAELDNPDVTRNLDDPSVFRAAINRARATSTAISVTGVTKDIGDEISKVADGYNPDQQVLDSGYALLNSGVLTESQKQTLGSKLEDLQSAVNEVLPYTREFENMSGGELEAAADMFSGTLPADTDNYAFASQMRAKAVASAAKHAEGRLPENFGNYSQRYPEVAKAWNDVLTSTEDTRGGAYSKYKALMAERAAKLRIANPENMPFIPTDDAYLAPLKAGLDFSSNVTDEYVLATAGRLNQIFGADAPRIADALSDEDSAPILVALVGIDHTTAAFSMREGNQRLSMMESKNKTAVETFFQQEITSSGRVLDWNVYGNRSESFKQSILELAVGFSTKENLNNGVLTDGALERAAMEIVGPKMFMLGATNTASYRDPDRGYEWVKPDELQIKVYALSNSPSLASELGYTALDRQGNPLSNALNASEVFKRGAFRPSGGSVYTVTLPASVIGGYEGKVYRRNANGDVEPWTVDFNDVFASEKDIQQYKTQKTKLPADLSNVN